MTKNCQFIMIFKIEILPNGGSGTSWNRSSLVNIRVPWLRMCQSLRRTQESCKKINLDIAFQHYYGQEPHQV